MSDDTIAIQLLQDWNGHRAKTILPIVPKGQAKVMVEKGTAKYVKQPNTTDSDAKPTSKRAGKSKRSKKTSGNSDNG